MSTEDSTRLRELLAYNKRTGLFTWRKKPNRRIRVGDTAGTPTSGGYVAISFMGRPHLAHRLAWLHVNGVWPPEDVDHINGLRSDNRLSNLRLASRGENMQNQRTAKGVSFFKRTGRWLAEIQVNKVRRYLGYYATETEARAAYLEAKRIHHPFAPKQKATHVK